jgi:hypothetical protein
VRPTTETIAAYLVGQDGKDLTDFQKELIAGTANFTLTEIDDMTYANARAAALAFIPKHWRPDLFDTWKSGGGGSASPGGVHINQGGYVWFAGDAKPARTLTTDQIAVHWSHDPKRRVYMFSACELWDEMHSGVSQMAMPL